MKKKMNIIDELSVKMLGGTMEDKTKVEEYVLQQIDRLEDINLKGRDGRTLLIHSCIYDYYAIAERLIKMNASVNIQDDQGYSALHMAVLSKDIDIVMLLLNHGASANLSDVYGNNPSTQALRNWDLLRILMEYGCDVYHKNIAGVSAYDVFKHNPEIMDQFQKYVNTETHG